MSTSLDGQAISLIEEHVRRLLQRMGFDQASVRGFITPGVAATEDAAEAAGTLHIAIEAGEEGRLLIGVQGSHLAALQHIIRAVLRRQIEKNVLVMVDVNGYRSRREKGLLGLAEAAARRAKMQGRTVVLRPMEASDRRAIHTALATRSDVRTESMGEEPNRRVVIRPIFL